MKRTAPSKTKAKGRAPQGTRLAKAGAPLARAGSAARALALDLREPGQGRDPARRDYRPPAVPAVEAVGLEERAASLAKRSIKKASKVEGLHMAIAMMDLTTLEGKDTPGKVLSLCRKAMQPSERLDDVPSCAAVCVYPNLVPVAKRALEGSKVKVASVATAFPSGQSPLSIKLDDVRRAVAFGADEIDMVIDRGAFLRGDYGKVFDEIAATKEACGKAHLKVILETGELGTYDAIRLASAMSIEAGADFIKTSTGKVQPAATLPVTLLMLEVIRDYQDAGWRPIGMKPAGGVRSAKQALQYLCVVQETMGPEWLDPDLFRFGASALLNDVLMQLEKERFGRYSGEDYFSKD